MRIADTLFLYLEQRIIVFPIHFYMNTLITRVIDRLSDWNILSDKKPKIHGKEKYFKFFVEKEINDILLEVKIVFNKFNFKIITIYNQNYNNDFDYINFIENQENIKKSIISIYKKKFKKYFFQTNLKFLPSNKKFKNLYCGESKGEEIEFLNKIIKSWTNM